MLFRLVVVLFPILALGAGDALAQRDLTDIPEPNPAQEMEAMTRADGASVNLYAADPQIRKPIQINFDSRGRLWVASSEVYPQIKPGQIADDKILVLEDTTGDGVCDKSTVFADGLLIPTGVVPDNEGGAYVAASTELLHFADTDGDGVADEKRVVLTGFGTEDTHHLIHTLRWGPDGCLYFNQSIYIHSHVDTPYGRRHLDGGGIWRYRPETGELSVFCKGFVNPWGHVFDAYGESFVTDGAYFEGINYAFPDSVFATSPGAVRWLSGLNPGSPKHCGLEIISGTHFPEDWAGDLVTSDFRGHRVCRFTVRPSKSTYTSRQQPELLTSRHIAFRPIDARIGPDGALYVADWYNPIIQHGEVDFRDERRDRERGRIWRLHFPDRQLDRLPDFAGSTLEQLIELLESPSLNVRQFARQQLWLEIRRDADAVLSAAARWRDQGEAGEQKSRRALEHQWLGEVAGRFSADSFDTVMQAEATPARRTSLRSAVRAAGLDNADVARAVREAALGDHAPSRLEAIVALGQSEGAEASVAAAEALIAAADRAATDDHDAVLDFALWQSLRSTSEYWVQALAEGHLTDLPHEGLAFAVSAAANEAAADAVLPLLSGPELTDDQKRAMISVIAASGNSAMLGKLLQVALDALDQPVGSQSPSGKDQAAPSIAAHAIEQLVTRADRDRTVPDGAAESLASRFDERGFPEDAAARRAVVAAVGAWKVESLVQHLLEIVGEDEPKPTQSAAIAALGRLESRQAASALRRLAEPDQAETRPQIAAEAAAALAVRRPQEAGRFAAALIARLADDEVASRLAPELMPNQAAAKALAASLTETELSADRAREVLSAVRRSGGNAEIEAALKTAGRLDKSGWEPTPELADEILAAAAESGDPARGEAIYRRAELQCVNCHAIGPAGGLVGPNLISLGAASQPDYILESLWLPDAKLKEGYNTLAVLTDDGRVTSGIPIGRTEDTLKLRLADGKEVEIATETIEQEQPGKSLMPAGAIDSLSRSELIDLVAFLAALGRDAKFTVSTDELVRTFETLRYSPEANRRLNRTSIDAVAGDDEIFEWSMITARVDGRLPLEELDKFQQHRGVPPFSFVRFAIEVESEETSLRMPARAVHLWINGKPTPPETVSQLNLPPGKHKIVVGIDRDNFEGAFVVGADGR